MSRVTEACSDKEATHTVTWKKASQTAEDGEWGAGGPQLLQNHCSIYYFLAISLNPPPKNQVSPFTPSCPCFSPGTCLRIPVLTRSMSPVCCLPQFGRVSALSFVA